MGIAQNHRQHGKRSTVWCCCLHMEVATTSTSKSVPKRYAQFKPVSGGVVILDMMINALYGGVGGLGLNYFIFIIIAVFISGLMVGRTRIGHKKWKQVKINLLHCCLPF